MSKKITALKNMRNGVVSHVKRLLRETDNLSSISEDYNCEKTRLLLEDFQSKLNSRNDEIFCSMMDSEDITEDEISKETTGTTELDIQISERITELKLRLSSKVLVKSEGKESTFNAAKLPKITLPRFNGDSAGYISFMEMFDAEIDRNNNISDIHKFNYLFGCLDGKAKDAIVGIHPSAENYITLRRVLHENFGNPKKIIRSLVYRLIKMQCPNNAKDLRTNYNEFMNIIRSLESLNVDTNACAPVIIPITEEKLPLKVKMELSIDTVDKFDINSFQVDFRRQVEKYEVDANSNPIIYSSDTFSESSFSTSTFANVYNENMQCQLCSQSHKTSKCNLDSSQISGVIRQKRLCILCLNPNHFVKDCTSKSRCFKCNKRHHIVLHGITLFQNSQNNSEGGSQITNRLTTVVDSKGKNVVFLKTARAFAYNGNNRCPLNILFDEGSQKSYMLSTTAHQLGIIPEGYIDLTVNGFHAQSRHTYGIGRVNIDTMRGPTKIEVLISKKLVAPVDQRGWKEVYRYIHTGNVFLADNFQNDYFHVDLLIGNDHVWDFFTGECMFGAGPTLQMTTLGAVLSGTMNYQSESQSSHSCYCLSMINNSKIDELDTEILMMNSISNSELSEQVSSFFKSHSVLNDNDSNEQINITQYLQNYKRQIVFRNGKYQVPLPWNENKALLPSNLNICKSRLQQLVPRLQKSGFMKKYCDVIEKHLSKGYIEELFADEAWKEKDSHFLPHFHVLKDSATTPIRIVFAANTGRICLNDCLFKGPCLLQNLCELIIRFRVNRIGLVADIAQAFLNVNLLEEDRNFVKFIWFRNNNPNKEWAIYRCTTVVFGHTSSPFSLNATLEKHLEENPSKVSMDMKNKFYVDNLVTSVSSDEEATKYYYESKQLLKRGGFNLRQWLTSSEILSNVLTIEGSNIDHEETSVLGLRWNSKTDQLSFYDRLPVVETYSQYTKRSILSELSSVFDPLGILMPVIILPRIFVSSLWSYEYKWDDPLPVDLSKEWLNFRNQLKKAMKFKFLRCLQFDIYSPVQIHLFTDANVKVLGAVVYMKQGSKVQLIGAKSKIVKCLKKSEEEFTIPRLELKALVLGIKYLMFLKNIFDKDFSQLSIYGWTDSQVTLHWLYSDKILPKLIQNDIVKIKKCCDVNICNYVMSQDNPADLITRGLEADKFYYSNLWFQGPNWLSTTHAWQSWQPEVASTLVSNCYSIIQNVASCGIGNIIESSRFSSFRKLLRVTALVRKFCGFSTRGRITKKDMDIAETLWITYIQQHEFTEELLYLKNIDSKKHGPSRVRQLNLTLDKCGVIRASGRLQKYVVSPVLLPREGWFTHLLVEEIHSRQQHAGVSCTIVAIRQRYWIPLIRVLVRNILKKCVICRKIMGRPYLTPKPPDLPLIRLKSSIPFEHLGMDFTGAINVRDYQNVTIKVYICLFTCLTFRCVNLELVSDLTADAFILALRRHCAVFSVPSNCLSDNATNFKAASLDIQELLKIANSDEACAFYDSKGIIFKNIPVKAPWWGGCWERLVGVMKTSLKKVLGLSLIKLEELQTLIKETQAIMNDRPLTYVSNDIDDLLPLTPAKIMYGYDIRLLPHVTYEEDKAFSPVMSPRELRRCYRYRLQLFNSFHKRFKEDYLSTLRDVHGHQKNRQEVKVDIIKVGDVVIVYDKNIPRIKWKLAVVQQLHKGDDNLTRAATIKFSDETCVRAIGDLFPLEINDEQEIDSISNVEELAQHSSVLRRSARSCIAETNDKIKDCIQNLENN